MVVGNEDPSAKWLLMLVAVGGDSSAKKGHQCVPDLHVVVSAYASATTQYTIGWFIGLEHLGR